MKMRFVLAIACTAAAFSYSPAAVAEDKSEPPRTGPPRTGPTQAKSPSSEPSEADALRPTPAALERRERRERAGQRLEDGDALLVLSRGGAKGFTGQVRSDDFHYVSPIDSKNAAVLVFRDAGVVRHHIYLPRRLPRTERWDGPTVGPGEKTAALYAFDAALPAGAYVADVARLARNGGMIHVSATAPADGRERLDTTFDAVRTHVTEGVELREWFKIPAGARRPRDGVDPLARSPDRCVIRSAAALLTDLRSVKSEAEIERVRRAVEATVIGLNDTARTLRPGLGEFQIEGLIEFRCKLEGCEKQAFDSIVGSGPNSCILHYKANRRIMKDGDIVVVDVGGEFDGYAADVTRTFPVNGKFSERQAQIYDAVLEAQEAGIAAVKPGVTLRDVHAAARAVLVKYELSQWFIHGTSHSVGLNVHDVWGRTRKLKVGSILTVEPGVYIPDEELGVRIEDTVLVTEDGAVILSAGVPKSRAAIEALMAEDAPIPMTAPEPR